MIPFLRVPAKSILSLMLFVLSALPASADRFLYGDLWFETTSENTCEVTKLNVNYWEYNYALTEVSIPELAVHEGKFYTVTAIGNDAFCGCMSLTNLTIPSSVTTIGDHAFYDCSSITSIDIPNSVTTIGDRAFSGCSSITNINMDATNTTYASIDGVLFSKDITTIVTYPAGKADSFYSIPNSVTTIGDGAFYGCSSLTNINIPYSVTTIGNSAFKYCTSLTSIDIPNSVTTIGEGSFAGCTGLTSFDIPNSVTTIAMYTFNGCSNLESIKIPNSVTIIEYRAFSYCESLTKIDIPNSVTTIGCETFWSCRSLTSINIPNSVITIVGNTFAGCSSLTSIDIPSSVTTIGDWTFNNNCTSLTNIYVDVANPAYTSIDGILFNKDATTIVAYPAGRNNSSYNIPNSVTTIGDMAFGCCESLTSINILNSVATIGDMAFYRCSNLTVINNYALVPQAIESSVFSYGPPSATLHVVKGYKDVYEAAEVWNQFNIVDDLYDVTPFAFEQEEYRCAVGESFTPSVVGIDTDALEWTTSDSSILYIDPVYHLCLARKEGIAYITAAQKGHLENSATVRVIVGNADTAIESLATDAPATGIYTLDGRCTNRPKNGIGIVRTEDGKTRKVWMK